MIRKSRRLVVLACVLALGVAALAAPSGAVPAQQQGVNKKTYDIVALVADLDGLRAQGLNLPEKLTVANLTKRWQVFFDSYGKVNGRRFNVIPVTWNPVDSTSFEPACVKATQDNKPFAVFNANGYRASSVGCITVDYDTFMFYGEAGYDDLFEASGKNLVTLGVPAEVAARTGARIASEQGFIEEGAKIGILSGNEPAIKAAGDEAEAALKKAGFDVVSKVEINIVGQDGAGQQRDAAAAVATMKAAGATEVVVVVPFTINGAFFDEAEKSAAGFGYIIVDAASSLCTQFGASRTPVVVAEAGVPCVTTWDTRAVSTKDGVKDDNEFEAECRATFDKGFGQKSQPGVPAGDITDAAGNTLTEDLPPNECVMVDLFVTALKKAGKNATTADVYDELLKIKNNPAAYMSNGSGGFGKNKPYFANEVHLEVLNPATTETQPDASGLYNGCPAPINCWVPQEVDGTEWFRVQQAAT